MSIPQRQRKATSKMGNSSSDISKPTKGQIMGPFYTSRRVLNAITSTDDLHLMNKDYCEPLAISQFLRNFISELKYSFISKDGLRVDYDGIRNSAKYKEYVLHTQVLSSLDLAAYSEYQLKAFCLNVYNALVIHALIEGLLDNPESVVSRMKFFASATYDIGGYPYNLNDLENGLLRKNRLSAVPFTALPFSSKDSRLQFMLPKCDPRIHFALNCGATSCPPISEYSSDYAELEDQLNMAAESFLSDTVVDVESETVTLSTIIYWYKMDFGPDDLAVLHWIRDHCGDAKRSELVALLEKNSNPRISYMPYDWKINA